MYKNCTLIDVLPSPVVTSLILPYLRLSPFNMALLTSFQGDVVLVAGKSLLLP